MMLVQSKFAGLINSSYSRELSYFFLDNSSSMMRSFLHQLIFLYRNAPRKGFMAVGNLKAASLSFYMIRGL